MPDMDLCYMPAREMAARIAAREISPVDLVRNSLERIEAVNSALNCFCFTYPEEALDRARSAEDAVMRGDPLGPMHGVPVAFKDFTPTKGKTTTRGSIVYKDWVPDEDARIVQDLIRAGAIMVGKTTTPEFAHAGFTHSPLWGVTRNPWNTEKSPGGSSGGSAAAVASGCVPLAEGSDMGGSVRLPAAMCGCVGLKPSLGRIPMTVLPTVFDTISHFGPLARTVDDAALFVACSQGPYEPDIMSLQTPIEFPNEFSTDMTGIRLALDMDLGFYDVDDCVAANVMTVAAALRDAGAVVEEVDLGWTRETVDVWNDYWCVYLAAFFGHHLEDRRDDLDPTIVAMFERAKGIDAITLRRFEFVRTKQWMTLCDLFTRYDALLCPTSPIVPPDAELRDCDVRKESPEGRIVGSDMTSVFNNVAQCPALSVPAGWTLDGLPTAIQIIGERFDDLGVLRVGAAIERHLPWASKRPSI